VTGGQDGASLSTHNTHFVEEAGCGPCGWFGGQRFLPS
jgi:hypothetical protein